MDIALALITILIIVLSIPITIIIVIYKIRARKINWPIEERTWSIEEKTEEKKTFFSRLDGVHDWDSDRDELATNNKGIYD